MNESSRALTESSEDERYHRLRKTCKKLRYLLEFFESSLDRRETRRLIKSLKRLQGELGRHQDCAVQAETFRQLGEQMQASGEPSAGTIMAVGVLVDRLNRDKNAHRAAFRRRFEAFARKGPLAVAPSRR